MKAPLLVILFPMLVPDVTYAACLQPDPAGSEVRFEATQAGAPIEGTFHQFGGTFCLDAADPNGGSIDVSIDTGSVDMGLPEFNEAMRGPEFFQTATWPMARFVSTGIAMTSPGHYLAVGNFTLRDRTGQVEAPFVMETMGDRATVTGEITIQRLDYDIGTGQWRDTRWVGDSVRVRFRVALVPAN